MYKRQDLNGLGPCTYITGGEFDSTYDAGLLILAELGNYVWHDLNGDGIQNSNEPGIGGIEVNLYKGDGTFYQTTTTNSNGYYIFEDLYPGEYFVKFEGPDGYEPVSYTHLDVYKRQPMMMGRDQMPPPRDRKMVPAENFGVKFISMAFLVKPDQPLIWRGPMLHSAIRQLLTDVEWGELDYLVVDLPPGTGDAQLTLAQVVPLSGAIVITQPMQVAAADAVRGLKTFEKLDVPIIGIIENMSGEFFGTGAGQQLSLIHI